MTADRPHGIIPGSGEPGESRRLDQLISVRAGARTVAALRKLAAADGVTAAGWIRKAIADAAFERSLPPEVPGHRHSGWYCPHFTMTAGAQLGEASCGAGCEMLPLCEPAA